MLVVSLLIFLGISLNPLRAQFVLDELPPQDDPEFESFASSLTDALLFSTHRPTTRGKLPGSYRAYFEFGGGATSIDDQRLAFLAPVNDEGERHLDDGFEALHMRAGSGLPFGFGVEAGLGHAFGPSGLTMAHASASYQVLDFAHLIYIDMVPTATLSTGLFYMLQGHHYWGANAQLLLGGYHRLWLAQFNYILQFNYQRLESLDPTYTDISLQHGFSFHWPLYEGFYIENQVLYPHLGANFFIGYQF